MSSLNQYLSLFCSLSLNAYEQHFPNMLGWTESVWTEASSPLHWNFHGSITAARWNKAEELLGRFYVSLTDNISHAIGWLTAVGTLLDLCRVIIKQMWVEETLSAHTSRPGSVFNAETVRLTTKNIVCYSNHTEVFVVGQVVNPKLSNNTYNWLSKHLVKVCVH